MRKRKKRKLPLSTLLVIVLVLIGLGVLFYPTLSDWYLRYQISREISQYNEVIEAEKVDYSSVWEEAEAYNRSLLQNADHLFPDESEVAMTEDLLNPHDSNVLGYVEIPAIDAELPIYRGTEEKQLQSGAGWWVGSSLPTGGESTHCILTGHTGLAKAKLFTDMDQLELGDQFTITVLDRKMTYEVDQILVTEPGDIEPLEIVEGEDYVTLYTCTPYGINTHRLLVRGHRTQGEPDLPQGDMSDEDWIPWLAFLIIPAAGLTILTVLFIRRRTLDRKHKRRKRAGERR